MMKPTLDRNGTLRSSSGNRGLLTLAVGQRHYLDQAVNMVRSARLHNPRLPAAIVTDSQLPLLAREFDEVVPVDPDRGSPFDQKLWLAEYSPFVETLYVDADCLIAGNLDDYFCRLGAQDVGVAGTLETGGHWYVDIAKLCRRIECESLPCFNSGLVFVRKSEKSSAVFETAREAMAMSMTLGIPNTHSSLPDEPALAIALAKHGIAPIANKFDFMPTHISVGFEAMDLDVVRGTCWYRIAGRTYTPRVAHFLAWRWQLPVYRREALKLRFLRGARPIHRLLSELINYGFAALQVSRNVARFFVESSAAFVKGAISTLLPRPREES